LTPTKIVADSVPAVQTQTANEAYREHLNSSCWACEGGHYCSTEEFLDWVAAREDSRVDR
jgi:hypothetical protein